MEESTIRIAILISAIFSVALLAANLTLVLPIYSALFREQGTVRIQNSASSEGYNIRSLTSIQEEGQRTISLTGVGTAKAKPDRAIFSFTVVTQSSTAKEAQRENAERMNGVVGALKELGLAENQTKTTGYSLYPMWVYPKEGGEPSIVGYTCSNTLEVTLKNLEDIGAVIDAGVSAGANQISSITFTISEGLSRQLELVALEKAVKDAEAKANIIATAAGLELVKPVSISYGSYIPTSVRSYEMANLGASTPVLAPEEVSVTVTVNVVYEFS